MNGAGSPVLWELGGTFRSPEFGWVREIGDVRRRCGKVDKNTENLEITAEGPLLS